MNIESVETFHKLFETKNFTKTAEIMGITEATVSYRIKELEKYLGKDLVTRNLDKSVSITEFGNSFYRNSSKFVDYIISIRNGTEETIPPRVINIITGEIAGIYFLSPIIKGFRDKYKGVGVNLEIASALETLTKLMHNESDIGFTASTNFPDFKPFLNSVKITRVFPIQLFVIGRPDTPILKSKGVAPEDLKGVPYVARVPTSGIQAEIDRVLSDSGIRNDDLNIVYRFQNSSSVISAVAEGLGISICSDIQARKYIDAGIIGYAPLLSHLKSYIYMIDVHNGGSTEVNRFSSYLRAYAKIQYPHTEA
ncbi:MAG: LysR substrate-binding domain-containing protein [Thermoplasmataceae archaeon]